MWSVRRSVTRQITRPASISDDTCINIREQRRNTEVTGDDGARHVLSDCPCVEFEWLSLVERIELSPAIDSNEQTHCEQAQDGAVDGPSNLPGHEAAGKHINPLEEPGRSHEEHQG